jgi:predicted RNA-binding Zn-ribbon protein involved in translation (DUF1610 family)
VPQIAPNTWKVALSFFWYREYLDGRVEQEFDLETGMIRQWGSETPANLKMVGWLPVTPDLAEKMKVCGEIGLSTTAPAMLIPVKPGDVPIIYKDCTVWDGFKVLCGACNSVFRSKGKPKVCPRCGAKPAWRCQKCGKLADAETCPDCKVTGRLVDPFMVRPEKWEEVEYFLGIRGKFCNRFNASRLITDY